MVGNHTRNQPISPLRPPAARTNALPKSGFKKLRRVTPCPWQIGHNVASALVILTTHRGRR